MQQILAYMRYRVVKFQSSPAPKGRCNYVSWVGQLYPAEVSILTGPEGPMQRARWSCLPRLTCFNPHRPRRADATPRAGTPAPTARVSILTGPEGPMQR